MTKKLLKVNYQPFEKMTVSQVRSINYVHIYTPRFFRDHKYYAYAGVIALRSLSHYLDHLGNDFIVTDERLCDRINKNLENV